MDFSWQEYGPAQQLEQRTGNGFICIPGWHLGKNFTAFVTVITKEIFLVTYWDRPGVRDEIINAPVREG